MLESFECNKPAHADDARHSIHRGRSQRREMVEVNPVIDPVNFCSGIWAPLAKQLAAIISYSRNKLRGGADFAQEIIVAQVLHEILPVRRYAERNS